MGITEAQRERRRANIGSSDLPAILGVDPYRSAFDVWAEKTGRLTGEVIETPAMQAGNRLERAVLAWASGPGGLGRLVRNQERRVTGTPILVHVDAVRREDGAPVEAKTSGLFGPTAPGWGEPGTDETPEGVTIQTHAHMLATGAEVCHVPALLGGRGFCLYAVPFSRALADIIIEEAGAFWQHVQRDSPPEVLPSIETIKWIRREPASVLDHALPSDIIEAWESAKATAREAQKQADACQRIVLAALGECEAAPLEDGRMLTYMAQTRAGYTVGPKTYRVARIVKAR